MLVNLGVNNNENLSDKKSTQQYNIQGKGE